ncbi:MAG TPA: aminoglycoside phosphotransferase family protein [Solirubrobacteraceae bacterium]|nr:aminoglycoside phosphotransferase family protein [Solirubrobacteraceae bacterium]
MPVGDATLRAALQDALQRPVRTLTRRAHLYGSSHAIEDVAVTFDDGPPLALVLKDVSAPGPHAQAAKPLSLRDPDRELQAYVDVLGPAGLDVPVCYGALAEAGRRWLILEAVDGVPLWQLAEDAIWDETARWLAGLHGHPAPSRSLRLLRYDVPCFRNALARAVALTPTGALDGVADIWERVVARLTAWPRSIVHGDFYPSNILVQRRAAATPRIRPVDWELAGTGPGLLDLAALTAGSWSAAERERLTLTYGRALPAALRPAPADLLDALAHCRLFVAVQWLGWSRDWTAPPEHAHDWLGEATALAWELAP